MRQEVTRAHKGWALDMVSLHNDATKYSVEEIKAPPPVNIFIIPTYLLTDYSFIYIKIWGANKQTGHMMVSSLALYVDISSKI